MRVRLHLARVERALHRTVEVGGDATDAELDALTEVTVEQMDAAAREQE